MSLKHQSSPKDYARKVVRHVLKKRPGATFCAGEKSTVLWALDTFAWHSVYVSFAASNEEKERDGMELMIE